MHSAQVTPPQWVDLHDVAILGAGPAGGAAACSLAETGLRVLLIEKDHLPRAKACGGAMPSRVRDFIDWDFSDLIEAEVGEQLYRTDFGLQSSRRELSPPMILVSRPSFDAHFVARAQRLGAGRLTFREGLTIRDVHEDAEGVTLATVQGETFRCRYLIAGDGATSRTARSLGLYRRARGAAIDVDVTVRPDTFETERARATFNLHCVPAGYGWIFPKSGHLSCGVGTWSKPRGLAQSMTEFLDRSFPPDAVLSQARLAHPVPVFQGHSEVATRRTCLIGDAAHLVDPVVGEGIIYAVQSGQLAAMAVADLCLRERLAATPARVPDATQAAVGAILTTALDAEPDCRAYGRAIRLTIGRQLNLIRLGSGDFYAGGPGSQVAPAC